MKLVLASDLHVDMNSGFINWPEGDAVLIAGDTANSPGVAAKYIAKVSKKYGEMYVVDGNHESYNNYLTGRTVNEIPLILDKQLNQFPKCDNARIVLSATDRIPILPGGTHAIVGANGWYTCDVMGDYEYNKEFWQDYMNDDRCCAITANGHTPVQYAIRDAQKVSNGLKWCRANKLRAVVMTHTAPASECLWWRGNLQWDRSNGFFMNSLMLPILEDNKDIIDLWLHGHTHYRAERIISGVRVICNPRGYQDYAGENPNWEPLVVEI